MGPPCLHTRSSKPVTNALRLAFPFSHPPFCVLLFLLPTLSSPPRPPASPPRGPTPVLPLTFYVSLFVLANFPRSTSSSRIYPPSSHLAPRFLPSARRPLPPTPRSHAVFIHTMACVARCTAWQHSFSTRVGIHLRLVRNCDTGVEDVDEAKIAMSFTRRQNE